MAHLGEWTAEELLQKVSICVTLVGRLVTGWQMQAFQLYRHCLGILFLCCSNNQSRRDRQAGALSFNLLLLLLLLPLLLLLLLLVKIMRLGPLSLMLAG